MSTPKVTQDLADWIVHVGDQQVPDEVRREGVRTFVNWLGCAVGGAAEPTVAEALRAVMPFSGVPTAHTNGLDR